jgi:RHS repeat-associated protein
MAGTTVNPYRFGGQVGYRRGSPARQYVRARHLDTTKGRWLSKDPVTDRSLMSAYPYGYAVNCPTTDYDPSGYVPTKVQKKPKPISPCNFSLGATQ